MAAIQPCPGFDDRECGTAIPRDQALCGFCRREQREAGGATPATAADPDSDEPAGSPVVRDGNPPRAAGVRQGDERTATPVITKPRTARRTPKAATSVPPRRRAAGGGAPEGGNGRARRPRSGTALNADGVDRAPRGRAHARARRARRPDQSAAALSRRRRRRGAGLVTIAAASAPRRGSIHERAITDPTVVCMPCVHRRHGSCTGWAHPLFGRARACSCQAPDCVDRRARRARAVA